VDATADPARFVAYLETTAATMADTKARLLDLLAVRPGDRVLDVGCGAGHDLVSLAAAGARPVGVDASAARMERLLQHVLAPSTVVGELRRVLRPGARLVSFEPVWSSLRVESDRRAVSRAVTDAVCAAIRQPDAGSRVPEWLRDNGFVNVAGVAGAARFTTLESLTRATDVRAALDRAVAGGTVPVDEARYWWAELEERSRSGAFLAVLDRTFSVGRIP